MISRRAILLGPAAALWLHAGGEESVRGRLRQDADKPPAITTAEGRVVELEADEATTAVLRDARLKNEDFEAVGRYRGPSRFEVDPIHERALFVWREGRRLVVTCARSGPGRRGGASAARRRCRSICAIPRWERWN